MIDKKILKQLQSSDPKQRRLAIVALADSRSSAALAPLTDVAMNDPEEKLRTLADRAQKHLNEQLEKVAAPPAAQPDQSRDMQPPAPREVVVTPKDIARGKAYMDEALGNYIAQEPGKAAKSLLKALNANPTLEHDMYFLSIVGNVFSEAESNEAALQMLMDTDSRKEFVKARAKAKVQKRKDEHKETATQLGWHSIGFDIAVYGIVLAVITFLAPLVITQLVSRTYAYYGNLSQEQMDQEFAALPADWEDTNTDIMNAGVPIFLGVGLIVGAVSAVAMLFQGFVIHQVARALGGVGTLAFMLSKIVPLYSFSSAVFFVWWCVGIGLYSIGAGPIGLMCLAPMGFGQTYVSGQISKRVGEAYDFSSLKGCAALSGAQFIMFLLMVGFGFLLQFILLNAFATGFNAAV